MDFTAEELEQIANARASMNKKRRAFLVASRDRLLAEMSQTAHIDYSTIFGPDMAAYMEAERSKDHRRIAIIEAILA